MATITGSHGLPHPAGHGHAHHDESYLHPKGGALATIWSWMTTIDHKKIGVMYLVAVLFMFFLGGVAALVVRFELFEPTRAVTDAAGKTVIEGAQLGKLFGAEGLHLADASLLCGPTVVNPQGSVMAVAHRNAVAFLARTRRPMAA